MFKIFKNKLLLAIAFLMLHSVSHAQNLLTESFDGATFPPIGWLNSVFSGSNTFNGQLQWLRMPGATVGNPTTITPHSGSGSAFYDSYWVSSGGTAELTTPILNFTGIGSKVVSFWIYKYNSGFSWSDQLDVLVNTTQTSTGATLIGSIVPNVTSITSGWYLATFNIPASFNTSTNYVVFKSTSGFGYDMYIDDVSIDNIPPCSGSLTANSVSPGGTLNICSGQAVTLSASGGTVASGIHHWWQYSTNGGTTWVNATGTGANNNTFSPTYTYTTPSVSATVMYRFVDTCASTFASAISNVVTISVGAQPYAAIPYTEDFESWYSKCGSSDAPSTFWSNSPANGNPAWRREDQGSTATWTSATAGTYAPTFITGSHSARFHAYSAGQSSDLTCFVDCSSSTATKELRFYKYLAASWTDSLLVYLSTNGGTTYSILGAFGNGTNAWTSTSLTFNSNSATTVIKFVGKVNALYGTDIGLDGVTVTLPCAGTPSTPVISANALSGCGGSTFNLSSTNASIASNINHQWQYLSGGVWVNLSNSAINPTTYTTAPVLLTTKYRLLDSCLNSGLTSVSNILTINIPLPTYAPLPMLEDFENWLSNCSTTDIPSIYWSGSPFNGNNSWRREDEGTSASWSNSSGGYSPAAIFGSHSARMHSYSTTATGSLNVYVNCSSGASTKYLNFYKIINSSTFYNDTLRVNLSTDGGATFNPLVIYGPGTGNWENVNIPFTSTSATTVISFQGNALNLNGNDMGIDHVLIVNECSSTPASATISILGSPTSCPGQSFDLKAINYALSGNLSHYWQLSYDNGATWTTMTNTNINPYLYTTPALNGPTLARYVDSCMTTGNKGFSNVLTLSVVTPLYAAIPYIQDFESWLNKCSTTDIPSNNWANFPVVGDASWRRNDQGTSATWSSTLGSFLPASILGSHCARLHTKSIANTVGALSLFVNCSTFIGNKELQFYDRTDAGTNYNDSVKVLLSTDAGLTYTTIGSFGPGSGGWDFHSLPITSNSATTIIRFEGKSSLVGGTDIGIDYVRVLPPCSGSPTAGTIIPVTTCPNAFFNLALNGTSQSSGLTFQWQSSANGTTWTNVFPGNTANISTSITQPTYFRCYVTCTNSSLTDTSASFLVNLNSFYTCYCNSTATNFSTNLTNIGNVTLRKWSNYSTLLNNGIDIPVLLNPNANNLYSDFTATVPTPILYQNDSIQYNVSQIFSDVNLIPAQVGIYIDFNHDGYFDPITELVFNTVTTTATTTVTGYYVTPMTALTGITGMRVVLTPNTLSPCGTYLNGETEDYLVNILHPACHGPIYPGIAMASDSVICKSNYVDVYDTTYTKNLSYTSWYWENSINNGFTWNKIAGATNKDTLNNLLITQPISYRLRYVCGIDTTTSQPVNISQPPYSYQCYCVSQSNGGRTDTSDIGSLRIGSSYASFTGGPHLLNPTAIKRNTNYAIGKTIELYTDSTYDIQVFHTMDVSNHADSRITLFMDFNNNLAYDVPSERVLTTSSSQSNFYVANSVYIPINVIYDQPTGMRLILNNNTSPNTQSDNACGIYTSGETEDYAVIFRKKNTTGINTVGNLQTMGIYPNPNDGKFTLNLLANTNFKNIQLIVTTITGQQIWSSNYENNSNQFSTEIDLTTVAKGLYFVEAKVDGEKMVKKIFIK